MRSASRKWISPVVDLRGLKRAGNLFFQALVKIIVNLPLAGQEFMQRIGAGPGSPMQAAPQFGDIRQVIGP
jgi:hypothetical protein